VQPRRGPNRLLERAQSCLRLAGLDLRPPQAGEELRLTRGAAERGAQLVDRLVHPSRLDQGLRQRQAIVHVVRPRRRGGTVGLDRRIPIAEQTAAGADLRQDERPQRIRAPRHRTVRRIRRGRARRRRGASRPGRRSAGDGGLGRRGGVRRRRVGRTAGRRRRLETRRQELAQGGLVEIERLARLPLQAQRPAGERQEAGRHGPVTRALQKIPEILEGVPGLRPVPAAQRGQRVAHQRGGTGRGRRGRPGEERAVVHAGGAGAERLRPLPAHLPRPVALHRRQVARLPRIALQVVQLERGAANQLEAAAAHCDARPIAEIVRERHRLGAHRQRRQRPVRIQERHEARPLHRPRRRQPEQVEERRSQVEEAHRLGDGAVADDEPGDAQQERDVQGRVVQPEAAAALAVLAEPLAVAAGDRHDRPAGDAERREALQQAADLRVGPLHLRVIRIAVPERPRGIGGVRWSRVGELHPQEEARPEVIVEPGARRVHHVRRRPLLEPADRRGQVPRPRLVEALEAARQAGGASHRGRADEGGGLVSRTAQHLGERRRFGRQRRARTQQPRAADRRGTGHQRQVGRQRLRHRGRRLLEPEPLGRQTIEVRRRRQRRLAVRPQAVDAQAVDAHQHEAQILGDRPVQGAAADALQRRTLERREAPRQGAEQRRDQEERQVSQHPDGPGAAGGGAHRSP